MSYSHKKLKARSVYIQTPKLFSNRGIVKSGKIHYLDFDIQDPDFKKFLSEIDAYCIKIASKNSEKWFNKHMSETDVSYSYKYSLTSDNKLKSKLAYDEYGDITTEIYDRYANLINTEEVLPNSYIIAILKLTGLWVSKYNIGCEWSVEQLQVVTKEMDIEGCAIESDSDDEYYSDTEIYPDVEPESES